MALDMSQIERIRDLRALGYSPSEIRRETGYSYPTIRKYLAIDDFSPKRPGARTGRLSLLDGLEGDIEEMLESDRHCYHKQRHTARRVTTGWWRKRATPDRTRQCSARSAR